jgi:hypothetical protein
MESEKRIEVVTLSVRDLKRGLGNPRKIKKHQRDLLRKSLKDYGDFGVIVVDEHNNLVSGNQRVAELSELDPDAKVLCKRLHGYSEAELRAINIKANTLSGEWDAKLLAEWTGDLGLDLGLSLSNNNREESAIAEMELVRFEKYDYVLIACRTDIDYGLLLQKLGMENKVTVLAEKRKNQGKGGMV